MKISHTDIEGLLVLEPQIFNDSRGYFFESFSKSKFQEIGITEEFIQDNESCSQKGTIRGLHFQAPPFAQGKLVRVIQGAVLDVAVDIRRGSPTYGKHVSILLSSENKKQFWIPAGFAHGFQTLENNTIFAYKCTQGYNKESEGGLLWNDPLLAISWLPENNPIISEKDLVLPGLDQFLSPFND